MKTGSVITVLILLIAPVLSRAQVKNELTNDEKKSLTSSWYESPRESKGNVITFRLEKHKFESGIDLVGYENSEIIIKKDQTFSVALWKWCPNSNEVSTGKWTLTDDQMTMNFSTKTCQCEIKILELAKDKLKVEIKKSN